MEKKLKWPKLGHKIVILVTQLQWRQQQQQQQQQAFNFIDNIYLAPYLYNFNFSRRLYGIDNFLPHLVYGQDILNSFVFNLRTVT